MNDNTKSQKQLTIPGFPEPRHREQYTGPKKLEHCYPGNPKYKKFEPLIPYVTVATDYFALYSRRASGVTSKGIESKEDLTEEQLAQKAKLIQDLKDAKKKHKDTKAGTLSRSGRARMKQRCGYLFYHSNEKTIHNTFKNYSYKVRLVVITLTLTAEQLQDDSFIKRRLYKNFIDALRKRYPGISYVWRAETQENGNIHFHILTDHYVPSWYSNSLWLGILKRHGYPVLSRRSGDRCFVQLNPVDLEKVKNEKGLARYMRKYMMKGLDDKTLPELQKERVSLYKKRHFAKTPSQQHDIDVSIAKLCKKIASMERRKVLGKLWGCSDNLVKKPFSFRVDEYMMHKTARENPGDFFQKYWKEFNTGMAYTRIFDIEDFSLFLKQFSCFVKDEFQDALLMDMQKVFPKSPCPYTEFYSNKNYSYANIAR